MNNTAVPLLTALVADIDIGAVSLSIAITTATTPTALVRLMGRRCEKLKSLRSISVML